MMAPLAFFLLSSVILRAAIADFAVLEPGFLANSSTVTLSTACVNALQSSVACDQYLQDNAYIDTYGPLNASVLDTFCTAGCSTSLISYRKNVVSACASDPQPYAGIPAQYFVDVIWAQYNFTCLKDPGTGQYCNSMCSDIHSTSVGHGISLLTLVKVTSPLWRHRYRRIRLWPVCPLLKHALPVFSLSGGKCKPPATATTMTPLPRNGLVFRPNVASSTRLPYHRCRRM